jgi:thiosulfate/3-mercaptopyruvate sulfurtransferase
MDRVVGLEWLAAHREDVRIVDVRDPWEYEGIGHIPGAVSIPFDTFRAEGGDPGMLPGADAVADLLGDAGIGPDDRIVAYDDTHGVFAARFLVTAELYGHDPDRLALLDGDYSAWAREHPTTTDVPEPTPTAYPATLIEDGPLIDLEAVEAALDTDAVIVDTREAWEFEEGHLPGAVRLDWRDLVDEESRGIKARDDCEALLAERGITPDRRVILYCNTARRISHTYVVLRHLGYTDLAFYEGSLTEWEAAGGAIETA